MDELLLWVHGESEWAEPTELERMASLHPLWREEIGRRAPWRPDTIAGLGNVLRAGGHGGGSRVLLIGRCTSVMDVAARGWEQSVLNSMDSVVAGCQWAGRGQLGRRWISPPGNLFAAWLIPPPLEGSCATSLLMGYAVWLALREHGVEAQLKWPNDVLIEHRKVAGILCEQRGSVLVAGVGVNIASHPSMAELRDGGARAAISLAACGLSIRPLCLWERIRYHARAMLDPVRRASLAEEIEPHLAFLGETVQVIMSGETTIIGRLRGLDRTGALWVEQAGRHHRITSGTVETIVPQEIVSL